MSHREKRQKKLISKLPLPPLEEMPNSPRDLEINIMWWPKPIHCKDGAGLEEEDWFHLSTQYLGLENVFDGDRFFLHLKNEDVIGPVVNWTRGE